MNGPHNKSLPGTEELMPYVATGDKAFLTKTYLLRPYPGSQIKVMKLK
jgi:hypothetical protein